MFPRKIQAKTCILLLSLCPCLSFHLLQSRIFDGNVQDKEVDEELRIELQKTAVDATVPLQSRFLCMLMLKPLLLATMLNNLINPPVAPAPAPGAAAGAEAATTEKPEEEGEAMDGETAMDDKEEEKTKNKKKNQKKKSKSKKN